MEDNIYNKKLKEFIGKKVKVMDTLGKDYYGEIIAINFLYLNVILKLADGRDMFIKNPQSCEEILKPKETDKKSLRKSSDFL